MAKFYGQVGYAETTETSSGVWKEAITKRTYYGDVLRNTRKYESGDAVNGNVVVNNTISIVADPYAYEHFFAIRFIEWMGAVWTVTNVEVQRPRLLLTIGGVFNGPTN